jgi:spore coat protein CotF
LDEANEAKNNHETQKIKNILEKNNSMRTEDEIEQVVKLIKHNKFFQGKSLKEKDMVELVSAFKFQVVN